MQFPKHRRSYHSMKRFYNWFHKHYGSIENSLGPKLDSIIDKKIVPMSNKELKTVLEYACGSGLLSLKLAPLFKSIVGRDSSKGMINRALERAENADIKNAAFSTGNIIEPDEESDSFNYVFVSFALHLFSPESEIKILQKLLDIAQDAVIIIDHGRKWDFKTAVVEWIEGSYYDTFIKQDYKHFAEMIGAGSYEEEEIEECTVLVFRKYKNNIGNRS